MSSAPLPNGAPTARTTRHSLIETFDGDEKFVDELVATFLIRTPALVDEIRSALEAGDAGAASRSAHSLKGMIGYFETGEAEAAARRLEHMMPGELALAPALLLALEQRLDELTRTMIDEFVR